MREDDCPPPGFDEVACLLQIHEPVRVETLAAEGPVEALYERIVCRLTKSREVDLCPVLVGPQVHGLTGELTAVVTEQHFGYAAVELQPVQHTHNIVSLDALSDFYGYCFACIHIRNSVRGSLLLR